jgi:hypothetical protein
MSAPSAPIQIPAGIYARPCTQPIYDPETGRTIGEIIEIATVRCPVCRAPVTELDGQFWALGFPYFASLHKDCAPHFRYDEQWPHEQPMAFYTGRRPRRNSLNTPPATPPTAVQIMRSQNPQLSPVPNFCL